MSPSKRTVAQQSEVEMENPNDVVPQKPPEEDVLDVLAEFESGLENLKALYAQRQRLQTRIRQHEEEVKAREAALTQRSAELDQAAAQHQARQHELEASLAKLHSREAELEAAAASIDQERASLEASKGKLDEETEARSKSLEAQAHKLATESQAVEKLTLELEVQAKALSDAKASFERERDSRTADLEEIESLRRDVAAQRDQLSAQEKQSRELQARVGALGSDLNQAREQAAAHAKAAQQAASNVKAAELASVKADEQQTILKQQLEEQAKSLASLTAASERAKAADKTLAELGQRATEFEQQLAKEKAETARVTAALSQQLQNTQKFEKVVEGLQQKLKMELEEREEMRRQLEAAQAGLHQATARSNQLETLLAKSMNEVKSLQSALEAKVKAPRSSGDASMLRRRHRLKIAHQLIRERSAKLGKASEALRKRMAQTEQIMAMRQELAAIRDRVILAERSSLRKQAGSRAAVMALCAVCIFGLLGAMSWAAARELAPATYIATSMLKADGRGRALNPGELTEWQQFHAGLLEDPRFHDAAADRFKKQGVTSLGSAGAIASMIKNELTTEGLNQGQLSLHLKGTGSEKTQRTLETFTAAFASYANAAQQQRLDGGVTEVSMAAAASVDPLDNTRSIYALAMLSGGVIVVGALWMCLWRRLAGAKTAFEQDGEIASALDDAKWASFAGSGAAAQVAGARARSSK